MFLAAHEALLADRVVLDGAEGRHAADVRRVRRGEPVDLTDGAGLLVHGAVVETARGRVVVEVDERVEVPEPQPWFAVVQAVAKGGRDEDAVAAMTEVGVDEVVAWQAARCVARSGERTAGRWGSKAREAAKQAHRAWIPLVSGPVHVDEVAALLSRAALGIVLHEDATERLASVSVPESGVVALVVGPEGGITRDEVETFRAAGARVCRLGDTVLRTSTAGVAALSVLSASTRWR